MNTRPHEQPHAPAPAEATPVRWLRPDRRDQRIAHLAALAIVIHVAEAALPSPIPGVKPGLANVITVAALMTDGWRVAAWVTVLRCLAGSLLLGSFLSPTFCLSLAGAAAAIAALGAARWLPGIGALGLSVVAALAHMAAQFLVAWALFVPHPGLVYLLPPLMTVAALTGGINGILAHMMLHRLHEAAPDPGEPA